jgi:acetyl esterase/lipase
MPRESFERLPPAYIEVAGQDPFRDDGLLYAKLLGRAGIATKVQTYLGIPHAFFEFKVLDETTTWVPTLSEGLKWVMSQKV